MEGLSFEEAPSLGQLESRERHSELSWVQGVFPVLAASAVPGRGRLEF